MKDIPIQLSLGLDQPIPSPEKASEQAALRYEPGLTDQEIEAALSWVYNQMDVYIEAAAQNSDTTTEHDAGNMRIYKEPLVGNPYFPLNQDLELSALPAQAKGWLQQLFSEEATTLYNLKLPELSEIFVPEEATIQDMKRRLILEGRPGKETYKLHEFINNREKEIARKKSVEQAIQAKSVLAEHSPGNGIDLETLPPELVVELYTRLKEGANTFRELLFFMQLMTDATDLICHVAPELREDLLEILPTILIQGEYTTYNGEIKNNHQSDSLATPKVPWKSYMRFWSADDIGGITRLNVDREIVDSAESYPVWLVVTAHELLHALSFAYIKRFSSESEVGMTEEIKMAEASLYVVILEAISLAGEHMVYQELLKTQLTTREKQLLVDYGEFKYSYLRFANRTWKKIRDSFSGLANEEYGAGLKYSEGMELALAWKRRGWELNDLQALIKEMTTRCYQHPDIRSRSLADLKGISIQRHQPRPEEFNNLAGASLYEKIFRFLKETPKPSVENT